MILLFNKKEIILDQPHLILDVQDGNAHCKKCNEKMDIPLPMQFSDAVSVIIKFVHKHKHNDILGGSGNDESHENTTDR